jgi:hypothetical protein
MNERPLVAALADPGQKYAIAVVQTNIDMTLPVLLGDRQRGSLPYLGSVQDRTAILVRHNVAWGNATSDLYAARVPTDLGYDIVFASDHLGVFGRMTVIPAH